MANTDDARARRNGQALASAVARILAEQNEDSIIAFLLRNAKSYDKVEGFDASSIVLPPVKVGMEIVLGYEWEFLESSSEDEIVADILEIVNESLADGSLSAERSDYTI